jgi:hypothetical protein
VIRLEIIDDLSADLFAVFSIFESVWTLRVISFSNGRPNTAAKKRNPAAL